MTYKQVNFSVEKPSISGWFYWSLGIFSGFDWFDTETNRFHIPDTKVSPFGEVDTWEKPE